MRPIRFRVGRRQGKPTLLGRWRRLGKVERWTPPDGALQRVWLAVGLERGSEAKNNTGRCKLVPKKIDGDALDDMVMKLRKQQTPKPSDAAATRVAARGYWGGKPEPSHVFEFWYMGGPEKTFEDFAHNISKIGEKVAKAYCQDAVAVIVDWGRPCRRTKREHKCGVKAYGAVWEPKQRPEGLRALFRREGLAGLAERE